MSDSIRAKIQELENEVRCKLTHCTRGGSVFNCIYLLFVVHHGLHCLTQPTCLSLAQQTHTGGQATWTYYWTRTVNRLVLGFVPRIISIVPPGIRLYYLSSLVEPQAWLLLIIPIPSVFAISTFNVYHMTRASFSHTLPQQSGGAYRARPRRYKMRNEMPFVWRRQHRTYCCCSATVGALPAEKTDTIGSLSCIHVLLLYDTIRQEGKLSIIDGV